VSDAHADRPPPEPSPSLEDSLRRVGKAGKDGLSSAVSTARALHTLLLADFALARRALARAMVWMSVAAAFGVSSWLLLMGALIALLQGVAGLSWLAALSIAAGLSLAITALGVFKTLHYFEFTRMEATRRQLKALGLGDDEDDEDQDQTAERGQAVPAAQGAAPLADGGGP
jgi:hypothetical protein